MIIAFEEFKYIFISILTLDYAVPLDIIIKRLEPKIIIGY